MKKITVLLLIAIYASSCAGVGYLAGGKMTTFEGDYDLPSKGAIEASKSKLKEILFADGWNKSKETENEIRFENGVSVGAAGMMGKNKSSIIVATFSKENVKLQITQMGNFKHGTEKSTNETFNKIKNQYVQ